MPYANLPGVQVYTVDGGLVARRLPRTKSTLVIGTASQGPAEEPYQVIDRAAAALTFGFDGNLVRAMEEVATFSDNIILYRMGTSAAVLAGVGREFNAGVAISNVALTSNVVTVTTGADHGLVVGDTVKVAAVSNTDVNGTFLVSAVSDSTHFSYALTHADIGSGADTGFSYKLKKAGFDIIFGERTATAGDSYKIWYADGVLAVWLNEELVYSNDSVGLGTVDTSDITISGTVAGSEGLALNNGGVTPTLGNAMTAADAALEAGSATEPAVSLSDAATGIGLTGRESYIALAKALDMLEIFPVDQVYCASAVFDQPNVAYYVSSDATTTENNPATNADALDWLKATVAADGTRTYQWASDSVDSEGNVVAPMGVVANAAARQAAGFYEAHFPYLLANFCEKQGEIPGASNGGCVAFIGTRGPQSYRLVDTRAWVGYLPTYDPDTPGKATVAGKGLLGIPLLVGTTAGKLNPLCHDKNTWRQAGMFRNSAQMYDGGADTDINQNPIDIGAYVHVVGDRGVMTNGWKAGYEANLAGLVAGMCSAMDEKSALTNKALQVVQLWRPSQSQLDALTFAKVNMLRFRDLGLVPVLLHGFTAASSHSDYISLLRVRIKQLLVRVIYQEADKFIGEASLGGLQLTALKTALESRAIELQKRGYISFAEFTITTTEAEQRIGHARVDVKFTPADELVQLNAYVGIVRR